VTLPATSTLRDIMGKLIGSAFVITALILATGSTPTASAQPKKKAEATSTLTIEVYKDAGDNFRFRVKDGDTNLAMASKGYDTKDAVMKVVNTLKSGMGAAKVVDNADDTSKAKEKEKKKDK
jgi:uncharacterized protein YegP (UPF0339 family)